jgi:hypothetical protein
MMLSPITFGGNLQFGLLILALLAAGLAPAVSSAAPSSQRFTIGSTGVTCSIAPASVSCQSATSSRTVSATLSPEGKVATCSAPQGSSPGCVLWPGAVYKNFVPAPPIGRFACIPLGSDFFNEPTGVVCTVIATGQGFRITAGTVSRVNTISPRPHPPCTTPALSAALERAHHERSLAPSYLSKGSQCVGSYALGQFIDVHDGQSDDVTVVFRAAGLAWMLGGAADCGNGEIPARIWYLSCAVN